MLIADEAVATIGARTDNGNLPNASYKGLREFLDYTAVCELDCVVPVGQREPDFFWRELLNLKFSKTTSIETGR